MNFARRSGIISFLVACGGAVLISLTFSSQTVFAEEGSDQKPFFEQDVFKSGQEGYHTFRIPALAVTARGTILAFCEGRKSSREDLGNNDMLLKRSSDGGRTWGKLQLIHEEGDDTIGNPTAVVDQDTGTIWLAMMHNISTVLLTKSDDDGTSWSKPVDITPSVKDPAWGMYAVGPGIGIQISHGPHKGRLVIPAYHRETKNKSGPSVAHVFYSDDHGSTWKLGGSAGLHTNECQVVEILEGGQSVLLLNMRNHFARSGGKPELAGARLVSKSTDGGLTWSEPKRDEALIEPTCQASIFRLSRPKEGKGRILFSNPASKGRKNLTVRLSEDQGRTWTVARSIFGGSSAYSCLAALPDGRIGLIYEREDYGKLTFASFTPGWLSETPETPASK